MWVVVAVVATAVALGSYLTWLAGRLDRLSNRCDAAGAALDAQMVRRAVAGRTLAEALADPALLAAADRALAAVPPGDLGPDRAAAESALSRALRAAIDGRADPPPQVVADVRAAATRVGYARQFHNDAVRDTRALRYRRLVRLVRLGAGRPLPQYFDIDDTPPGAAGSDQGGP